MLGVVLQVAYRLRRHLWLGWSLARWIGFLLVIAGTAALVQGWPSPWLAVALAGLLLVQILLLAWAGRRGYVHFEAASQAKGRPLDETGASPLRPEEMVPMRASGWFSVEGKRQYYVDLEADFETVGTREHIVLARVHPSRFLLLGRWPAFELGWWYMFFQPNMIKEITLGHLVHGPHPQQALRIAYSADEEKQETIHLAFHDTATLHRVWDDLIQDAPTNVAVRPASNSTAPETPA